MATLSGKSVTFPYGATSAPYSPSRPHKGDDYPLVYEPVVVAGTNIGISGETGLTAGPHTHVQAGRDEWAQSPIAPEPYTNQPGIVVKTGNASQWGNYVCVRVGDVNVFYCHLSQINVKVGQTIGENDMPNDGDIDNAYLKFNNRKATDGEKRFYKSKSWSAPDGLYYGKIFPETKGLQDAVGTYSRAADYATSVAGIRGDRLNTIATQVGAKNGDDFKTITDRIQELKDKPTSGINKASVINYITDNLK